MQQNSFAFYFVFLKVIMVGILLMSMASSQNDLNSCAWREFTANSPELFYVNMDKSVDRKNSIQNHLTKVGIPHRRVKGLTLEDIYFPKDIGSTWDKYESMIQTLEKIPARNSPNAAHLQSYSHIMAGLVGRAKKNKLKEIGCTSSHLEAMRQAIYHNRSSSRYAVITEDDIQIPFNIDFEALAQSAPPGFGILQLFNSNEESMQSLWRKYIEKGTLWTESVPKQAASFWSTCAYLIDREVLRPVIDQIAFEQEGFVHLKIIAGIKQPCRPKISDCCVYQNASMTFHFTGIPPCVWAAKGFQADSFIYSMARTYVLGTPLITNGAGGNQSTFHQDHVENIHQSAFARQREYINQLIGGKAPLPPFVSQACSTEVSTGMTLVKTAKCKYRDHTRNANSTAILWLNRDEHYRQRDNLNSYINDVLFMQQRRVTAVNSSDLFLPQDVQRTWETRHCTYQSDSIGTVEGKYTVREDLPLNSKLVIVSGLCGRGKGHNSLADLAVTVSHLLAIYQAVYHSPTANSRYALVVEDDFLSPFDVDYEALARTAPRGFGFLRLVTSNEFLLERQWTKFQRNSSDLWSGSLSDKYYDSWATKAYLVDREVLRPVIDALLQDVVVSTPAQPYRRLQDVKVLAGLASPCLPLQCCNASSAESFSGSSVSGRFEDRLPCVLSKTGFQSERFLFHLAPTYALNVPLFTANLNGLSSTLKGEALDASHWSALKRHREIINTFLEDRLPLPSFATIGCSTLLK